MTKFILSKRSEMDVNQKYNLLINISIAMLFLGFVLLLLLKGFVFAAFICSGLSLLLPLHLINFCNTSLFIMVGAVFGFSVFPWYLLDIESNRTLTLVIISLIYLFVFLSQIIYKHELLKYTIDRVKKLWPILFFTAYLAFTLLNTIAPQYGKIKTLKMLGWVPIIVFLAVSVKNNRKIEIVRKAILFSAFIAFLAILINFPKYGGGNRLGIFKGGGSLNAGRILGAGFLCLFGYYFETISKPIHLILSILMFIFLVAIFATGTRQALIGIIVACMLYYGINLFLNKSSTRNMKVVLLIIFIVGVLFFSLGFFIEIFPSISRPLEFSSEISENPIATIRAQERVAVLYPTAVRQFIANPITGGGVGSYAVFWLGIDRPLYPHNIFLEVMCELGLVGLFFFLLLLINCIKAFNIKLKNTKNKNERSLIVWVAVMWAYFLIIAQFTQDIPGNYYFWMICPIMLILNCDFE